VPKKNIPGTALVLGNDFDQPIRDQLPPFFGKALQFVKSWIDPGLDGDPYADKPYLFGPLLSSANVLSIGTTSGDGRGEDPANDVHVIEEGDEADDGKQIRDQLNIPHDGAGRQKFFLTEDNRKQFQFEQGRQYELDFFNGYLDFNGRSLPFVPQPSRTNGTQSSRSSCQWA
jgi:hypothetical protein